MGTLYRLYLDMIRVLSSEFNYKKCFKVYEHIGKVRDGKCFECRDKGCPYKGEVKNKRGDCL